MREVLECSPPIKSSVELHILCDRASTSSEAGLECFAAFKPRAAIGADTQTHAHKRERATVCERWYSNSATQLRRCIVI